jgi:hypothetical protein
MNTKLTDRQERLLAELYDDLMTFKFLKPTTNGDKDRYLIIDMIIKIDEVSDNG